MFHMNVEGIRKVMALYHEPNKKYFTRADAFKLFVKDTNVGIGDVNFQFCYAVSKMTVVSETTQEGTKKYNRMQLVEMLELIGRIAEKRYEEVSGMELVDKIAFVLEELFKLITNKVQQMPQTEEFDSESDEDY